MYRKREDVDDDAVRACNTEAKGYKLQVQCKCDRNPNTSKRRATRIQTRDPNRERR